MVFAVMSCGDQPQSKNADTKAQPSSYQKSQVCDRFITYMKDNLGAIGLSLVEGSDGAHDEPIEWSVNCVSTDSGQAARPGILQIFNPRADGTVDPSNSRYQRQDGFNEKVWMTPDNDFRTQVGPWVAEMSIDEKEVRTPTGTLHMTNEQVRTTIEFLIQITSDLQNR